MKLALRLLVLTLTCAAVLSLCASESSPFFPDFTSDYAVFRIASEGWLHGGLPYHDLFDHKGPMALLPHMLGLLIWPGKAGVFIVEVIFAVATFEMMYRCGRVLGISDRLNYVSLATGMILLAGLVEGGATVEEWSLPFQALPLLLGLRWLRDTDRSIVPIAFVSGICFGLVALIRINDNNIICGLCAGIAIILAMYRRYIELAKCIASFIGGIILAILPFVVYFAANGILDEYWYANFTYNIHYRTVWAEPDTFMTLARKILRLTPCIMAPVAAYFYGKSSERNILITVTAMSAFTVYAFLPGNGFSHYYLMAMPLGVLAVQLTSSMRRAGKLITVAAVCGPVAAYYCAKPIEGYRNIVRRHSEAVHRGRIHPLTPAIEAVIPAAERGSVYIFGGESAAPALLETGHMPVGKYFFGQIKHFKVDSLICRDIAEQFSAARPLWIVAHLSPVKCAPLQPMLSEYTEIPADSIPVKMPPLYHIYRHK